MSSGRNERSLQKDSPNDSTWTIPITQETESHPEVAVLNSRSLYLQKETSKKTKLHITRRFLLILAIFAFITAALIVTVGIISYLYHDLSSQPEVCTSIECIQIAAILLESMDKESDPCEDFYKYTCGKWREYHQIPDNSIYIDWFFEIRSKLVHQIRDVLESNITNVTPEAAVKAQKMYQSCINKDKINKAGLQPIWQTLNYAGLPKFPDIYEINTFISSSFYPVLVNGTLTYAKSNQTNLSSKHKWLESFVGSRRIVDLQILIGFWVSKSPTNRNINVLTVGPPIQESPLPDYDHYNRRDISKTRVNRWQKLSNWEGIHRKRIIRTRSPCKQRKRDTAEQNNDKNTPDTLNFMENMMTLMEMWSTEKNFSINPAIRLEKKHMLSQINATNTKKVIMKTYIRKIFDLKQNLPEENKEGDLCASINDPPSFEKMKLDDLQRLTDEAALSANLEPQVHIDWNILLTRMFEGSNVKLDFNSDLIHVSDPDYLKNLSKLLANTKPSVLEGLIWWEVIDVLAPHSILRPLHITKTNKIPKSREMTCTDATNEMMGMAVAWLLVNEELSSNKSSISSEEKNFIGRMKTNVEEMVTNIKESFYEMVSSLDWMDFETKKEAIKKAKEMRSVMIYPSWLMNQTALNEYYEGIEVNDSEYLQNLLNNVQIYLIWTLESLREENEPEVWASDPTDVNAFHSFEDNAITLPAAVLRFPLYGHTIEALNYAATGSIIGHELTHGFDSSGRCFDEIGNWRQWWNNVTDAEFVNRTECFVKQYSAYWIEEANGWVNGKVTLGENIADNGGLEEAYRAFKIYKQRNKNYVDIRLPGLEHFSDEQLFFLMYGNSWCEDAAKNYDWNLNEYEHSPGKARIWGTVSNSEDFSRVFNCPIGSPMNPQKKCKIW